MSLLDLNNETDDPFAGVDFSSPAPVDSSSQAVADAVPTVTADGVNTLLRTLNNRPTPFTSVMTPQNAGANTAGGIARVNADTGKTGVVATRDANGQASFTNVAIDTTGKEAPILPGVGTGVAQRVTGPLALSNILGQLATTTDSAAARGLFASFQEASAAEQVRLQTAALAQAQAKLGIPGLEAKLAQSEAADQRSIGYYPGIGDSPITQTMRKEVEVARGYAATEAQSYLNNNLNYKILDNQVKQAQQEMVRVQKLIDRKGVIADTIELRGAERDAQKLEDAMTKSDSMSQTAIARVQMLQGADFQGSTNPRLKAYQLYVGNKDKNFHAAVDAQGEDLPFLAIKGNKYAQELVAQSESANTGQSVDQVKQNILQIQKTIDSPNFLKNVMDAKYPNDKKKAAEEFGNLNAMLKGIDPTKKQEATDQRIRLALDFVAAKKTATFMGDVNSWGSTDPSLLAATTKAFQTTGRKDFESVLASYLGDSTGPDMLSKLSEFKQLSQDAALKQKNSVFGMPNYTQASAIITRHAVENSVFQKWLESVGKKKIADINTLQGAAVSPFFPALQAASLASQGFMGIFDELAKPPTVGIDPKTGRPFGE